MPTSQELISHARSLMQSMQIAEAEGIWRDLAERHPQEPDLRTMIGVCRKLMGDTDNALEHLRAATELDAHHADSRFHLGQTLLQLGRLEEAEKALKKALAVNPNHVGARVAMAQILERNGRLEDATRSLRMALRADGDSVSALSEMSRLLLAQGREDEADKHASRAVQIQPEDARAQIAMSNVFRVRGQWDFAEQSLKNALEKAPNSVSLWSALGGLYQAAGRDGQAVAAFERAEQLRRGAGLEPIAILAMAESLHAIGHGGEARQRLEKLHQVVPLEGNALLLLAELRLADGDAEAARELLPQLEQTLGSGKRLVEAWLAEAAGDHESAAEQAARLHEVDHERVSRQARLLSGRLAVAGGDLGAAEKALSPLASRDPVAAWMLAEALRKTGDHDRGRELLERLLKESKRLGPEERAMTHGRLAWLLDEAGRYDSAGNHLERSSWQGLPHAAEMVRATPAALHDVFMQMNDQPWPTAAADDGRPDLLFVLGWPGSGRENIVRAMIDAGAAHLDPAGGRRRRQAIGLPLALADLQVHDDAQVRMARRRYFRGSEAGANRVLEPIWVEATDLPALARFFPQARVIVPVAEAGDLELHWRLSGYGRIDEAISLWQRDQALIDHLRERIDLEFIELPRAALVGDAGAAAEILAGALEQDLSDSLAQSLERSREIYPLKPEGRWREYADILKGTAQPA
jgi:tetratricopeptide (TPR) repeat protein